MLYNVAVVLIIVLVVIVFVAIYFDEIRDVVEVLG